ERDLDVGMSRVRSRRGVRAIRRGYRGDDGSSAEQLAAFQSFDRQQGAPPGTPGTTGGGTTEDRAEQAPEGEKPHGATLGMRTEASAETRTRRWVPSRRRCKSYESANINHAKPREFREALGFWKEDLHGSSERRE